MSGSFFPKRVVSVLFGCLLITVQIFVAGNDEMPGQTVLQSSLLREKGKKDYVSGPFASAFIEKIRVQAPDGKRDDHFGSGVAISGDTAVAGTPRADFNLGVSDRGAVYVYARMGSSWAFEQKLEAPDQANLDEFGGTVAIDGETIVVASRLDDVGANADQGSVYVFVRRSAGWYLQQKLVASDGVAADNFGIDVAISGETIVVGSYWSEVGANGNQGAAYVFHRKGEMWTQQAKLTADDGTEIGQFGIDVAIDGDTALIGAFGEPNSLEHGAAYFFERVGNLWTQRQKVRSTPVEQFDREKFGMGVALRNGIAVIGAPEETIPDHSKEGVAYVFTKIGPTWTFQSKLTAGAPASYELFGKDVAIDHQQIVVGACDTSFGNNLGQGAAYVFARQGQGWYQKTQLVASDGGFRDVFGEDVSIYSGTAFIGAAVKDIGTSPDQGAAYLYYDTNAPDLRLESDTGVSNADDITNSSNLAFELPNITIGAWVELLRNGVAVSSGIASGPTMTLADVNPPNGNSRYSIRQTLPDLTAIESSSTIVSVLTSLPTVSIDQSPNQSDSASSSPLNYRVRFSVPVSGFSTQSLSYAGSTANVNGISAVITGSGSTYNVAVTPVFPNQGLLRVSVLTDSAQDEFGNLAVASTSIDNAILFDGVRDGGFELTNSSGGNPFWNSTSQLRGTALCGLVRCGIGSPTSAPRKGDAWVHFAGSTGGPAEQASISQTVTLPVGGSAVLTYYLRMGYVNPPGASLLNVRLDGVIVQSISESSVADFEYVRRTVDLTPFADGGQHLLRFEFSQPGGATLDIFAIDDVSVSTPNVTVSGRIVNSEGRGVRSVLVRMTDSLGNMRTAISGPLGFYSFSNVQARDDFILVPQSRRYNFAPRSVSTTNDLPGIDFIGTP